VVCNMHKLWACQPTPATTKALLIGSIDRSSKQGSLRIHVSNLKQVAQTVWLSTVVWISILLCHRAEVRDHCMVTQVRNWQLKNCLSLD
jgi:hypothetical protein